MPAVDRPWDTPAARTLRAERAARAAVRDIIGERRSFESTCRRLWTWAPIWHGEWEAYMKTGVVPRWAEYNHCGAAPWTPAEFLAARKAELLFARHVTWRIRSTPGSCGRCRRASCTCETSHA
jgi:hypothetical protein